MAIGTAIGASEGRADLAGGARIFLWRVPLGAAAICTGVGLLSVLFGPDNYWDLRYYHLYAPWAYLHGRYLYDVAPAQLQGFFNPTADFLFYALTSSTLNDTPRVAAFVMGAVHGLNAVLIAAIAMHVLRPRTLSARVTLCATATLIGVSGPGFVSLLGTTTNDLINSIFILGALLGLLKAAEPARERADWRGLAWPGLLAGIGLGLKYTAVIYVPGLAAIALLAAARRRTTAGFIPFGVTMVLGFVAVAGPHLFTLWWDFGNPLFPMLNNIFHSPYYDPVSLTDDQFRARDLWQLIAYPLYWAKTNNYLVSEEPLRDWRGAMAYLAIAAVVASAALRHLGGTPRPKAVETRGLDLVLVFVVMSYLAWAPAFGNYRYGVALELLTGIAIVGALLTFLQAAPLRIGAATALLLVAIGTTVYPDWGRGRYGERYIDVRVPSLPPDSVVLVPGGDPVAYFIPFAEPSARFLGIENNFLDFSQHNRLVSEVDALMRMRGPPKFIVSVGEFDAARLDKLLMRFGLKLDRSPCRPIQSNLENPALSLCSAVPRS